MVALLAGSSRPSRDRVRGADGMCARKYRPEAAATPLVEGRADPFCIPCRDPKSPVSLPFSCARRGALRVVGVRTPFAARLADESPVGGPVLGADLVELIQGLEQRVAVLRLFA